MKNMKNLTKIFAAAVLFALTLCFSMPMSVKAADANTAQTETVSDSEESDNSILGTKALSAALVVSIPAAAGAIAMGMSISKSSESMARQPEAAGKINSAMMLGLVFIETLIIYALIVAILIIFVL